MRPRLSLDGRGGVANELRAVDAIHGCSNGRWSRITNTMWIPTMKVDLLLDQEGLRYTTDGRPRRRLSGLSVHAVAPELLGEAHDFLESIVDYAVSSNKALLPGETVSHGFWVVRLSARADGILEIQEYSP